MPQITIEAALLAGLLAGLLIAWAFTFAIMRRGAAYFRNQAESETARARELEERLQEAITEQALLAQQADRLVPLEAALKEAEGALRELTAEKIRLEADMKHQEEAFREKTDALTTIRGGIEKDLKALAADALRSNQTSFVQLAGQVFDKHKESAEQELSKRQEAIGNLLKPVHETLESYRKNLTEIEKSRNEAYGSLHNELKQVVRAQQSVQAEAAKLTNALKAAPKTRGRWGEQQLVNVMELSGMSEYVDFTLEESFDREEKKLRPDAIIRMPGGRHVVVDAKTSMAHYLEALEATDEVEREGLLLSHARQIRTHMKQLSGKKYWDGLEVTPDFVAMFIPGENFFAAAIERDQELFEDAVANRVLIVTPTTLIALAKAIAFGWRQEKVAKNAQVVAELGGELYKRMVKMGERLENLGKSLGRTVQHYNAAVGNIELKVMPQARKFQELEVEGTGDPLPELLPVAQEVQELRSGRDLITNGADVDDETK